MRMNLLLTFKRSKQISLLHYSNKLLLIDLPISISISLINHLLQLFISHSFSKFPRNPLQILQRNLSSSIIIKQSKRLQYLLSWISFGNLTCHQLHEISKLYHTFSLSINLRDHLLHFLFLRLETKSPHRNFQLFRIDIS
jgi:hypothetical protein